MIETRHNVPQLQNRPTTSPTAQPNPRRPRPPPRAHGLRARGEAPLMTPQTNLAVDRSARAAHQTAKGRVTSRAENSSGHVWGSQACSRNGELLVFFAI